MYCMRIPAEIQNHNTHNAENPATVSGMARLLIASFPLLLLASCTPSVPSDPTKSCLTVLKSSWEQSCFTFSPKETSCRDDRRVIVGEARNDCGATIGTAYVEFNLIDGSNAQIQSVSDSTRNLAPGVTWKFRIMWTSDPDIGVRANRFELAKASAYR